MDDKTDKTDDKSEKPDKTPDHTMPYIRMGDNTMGDNTIQDKVDKVDKVKAPARPKGPNAAAVVVGLVAMILAGLVIAKETMDFHVDWSRMGPGAIVGLGLVMLLIGAIGLVRRQDNDV